MSVTRYFRFSSPEVLEAAGRFIAQKQILERQAQKLAHKLGESCRPLFYYTLHGQRFAGVKFTPPIDSPLWTKPDRNHHNMQRVRTKVAAKHRDALKQLQAHVQSFMPTIEASLDPIYEACGTNWGNLMFSGLGYIINDDAVYLCTGLDLSAKGEEITGGEYELVGKERSK